MVKAQARFLRSWSLQLDPRHCKTHRNGKSSKRRRRKSRKSRDSIFRKDGNCSPYYYDYILSWEIGEGSRRERMLILENVYDLHVSPLPFSQLCLNRTMHLLATQGYYLDIMEVLDLIPDDWPIQMLQDFLIRSLRRSLHVYKNGQVVLGISRGENLKVKGKKLYYNYYQELLFSTNFSLKGWQRADRSIQGYWSCTSKRGYCVSALSSIPGRLHCCSRAQKRRFTSPRMCSETGIDKGWKQYLNK